MRVCVPCSRKLSVRRALSHSGGRAAAALSCQRIFILKKRKGRGEKKRRKKNGEKERSPLDTGGRAAVQYTHCAPPPPPSSSPPPYRVFVASRSSAVVPSALRLPHSRRSPVLLAGSSPIFAFHFRSLPFVCKRGSILVT